MKATHAIAVAAALLTAGIGALALVGGDETVAAPDARPAAAPERPAVPNEREIATAEALDTLDRVARQPSAAEREASQRAHAAQRVARIEADPALRETRIEVWGWIDAFRAQLSADERRKFDADLAELATTLSDETHVVRRDPDFHRWDRAAELDAELIERARDYMTPEELGALQAVPFSRLGPVHLVASWELFDKLAP